MVILRSLVDLLTALIEEFGLMGIVVVTAIESIIIPIPSEVVLPFAGYVAWRMNSSEFFIYSVAAAVIGNLLGATTLYYMGLRFGRRFFDKYGRYFFIKKRDLDIAEGWFLRYGAYAIFFGRMMPSIRSAISLPAGMFNFDVKKFVLLTSMGSIPWNFTLTYIGYATGPYWSMVIDRISIPYLDVVVIVVAVIVAITYLKLRSRRS
ncbi:MAG: DedA family protein [Nitrososphaeria archaeon]|nr:DedA family protein [Nitrososphaeria archaeon]